MCIGMKRWELWASYSQVAVNMKRVKIVRNRVPTRVESTVQRSFQARTHTGWSLFINNVAPKKAGSGSLAEDNVSDDITKMCKQRSREGSYKC